MQATITNIQYLDSWTGKYGPMHTFVYTLDNGQEGQVNHKTNSPAFQIGETVDYQVQGQAPDGTPKFKMNKPEQGGFSGAPSSPAGGPRKAFGKKSDSGSTYGQTVGCAANCVSRLIAAGKIELPMFKAAVSKMACQLIEIDKELESGASLPNAQPVQNPQPVR